MAVLYYTTNGPSWNNSHLNRDDVCTWNDQVTDYADAWKGVGCSGIGETIDSLILSSNNLVGSVPWELILLTDLKRMKFEVNRLTGSILTRF